MHICDHLHAATVQPWTSCSNHTCTGAKRRLDSSVCLYSKQLMFQSNVSSVICLCLFLFCFLFSFACLMYIFSTVNIKRWPLFSMLTPCIKSAMADGDTNVWNGSKVLKWRTFPPPPLLQRGKKKKKKLDWDNPVCHKSYILIWKLDCNFLSQVGGLMRSGWRRRKRYLYFIHSDWSASYQYVCIKQNGDDKGHVFINNKPSHPFHEVLPLQEIIKESSGFNAIALLAWTWMVLTALSWFDGSVASQGWQSQ